MKEIQYLQTLSLIQSRFPNLDWTISDRNELYNAILKTHPEYPEDVIPTDFLISIKSGAVEQQTYIKGLYSLNIFIDSKTWLKTYHSQGTINKILDDLESWMNNIYVAFKSTGAKTQGKKEELILLIDKAVRALNNVSKNTYYRKLKKAYNPDMFPEDGIIGCQQLIEYLCDSDCDADRYLD